MAHSLRLGLAVRIAISRRAKQLKNKVSPREHPKVRLDPISYSARVALLELGDLHRVLLLGNHEERALADQRRHPRRPTDRDVLIVNAKVAQAHLTHHAGLDETSKRFGLRMEEERARAVVGERIRAVAERIEMNRHEDMRVRSSR